LIINPGIIAFKVVLGLTSGPKFCLSGITVFEVVLGLASDPKFCWSSNTAFKAVLVLAVTLSYAVQASQLSKKY
jgi:hypothetical protein